MAARLPTSQLLLAYLAHHEDAAKTALQAGHTESVLFQHYRKLVRREDAEKFWGIYPRG